MTELVICRFDKALDWIADLKGCKVTVYNKGADDLVLPDGCDAAVIRQENVSYEDFTILCHVLGRWDSLADVTVFAQDDVLTSEYHIGPEFIAIMNAGFAGLCDVRCLGEPLTVEDYGVPGEPLRRIYEELFSVPCPERPFGFARSSQIAVSRDSIKARPFEFYVKALMILFREFYTPRNLGSHNDWRPWTTSIFERLWLEIFRREGPGPRCQPN